MKSVDVANLILEIEQQLTAYSSKVESVRLSRATVLQALGALRILLDKNMGIKGFEYSIEPVNAELTIRRAIAKLPLLPLADKLHLVKELYKLADAFEIVQYKQNEPIEDKET